MGKTKLKWWHWLIVGAFLIAIIYTLIQRGGIPGIPTEELSYCASGYECHGVQSRECFILYGYPYNQASISPEFQCQIDGQCTTYRPYNPNTGLIAPTNIECCIDVGMCGVH